MTKLSGIPIHDKFVRYSDSRQNCRVKFFFTCTKVFFHLVDVAEEIFRATEKNFSLDKVVWHRTCKRPDPDPEVARLSRGRFAVKLERRNSRKNLFRSRVIFFVEMIPHDAIVHMPDAKSGPVLTMESHMSDLGNALLIALHSLPSDTARLRYLTANVRADSVKEALVGALESELAAATGKAYRRALAVRVHNGGAGPAVYIADAVFVCPAAREDVETGHACRSAMGEQTHADVGVRRRDRQFRAIYADNGAKVTRATVNDAKNDGREIIADPAEKAVYSGTFEAFTAPAHKVHTSGRVTFAGHWFQVQATCKNPACKRPTDFPNAVNRYDVILGV
jgi:hypothetical protein